MKVLCSIVALVAAIASPALAQEIVHDGEYYFLQAQVGEAWSRQDAAIDAKPWRRSARPTAASAPTSSIS